MKYRLKNRNWFVCLGMRWLLAGFFCTGLTGCADRSAEFLVEDSGGQETEESGDSSFKEQKISETEDTAVKKESQTEEKEKKQTVDSADDTEINNAEPQNFEPQKIFVDVCGAVSQPGVFELTADSRVFQAIEAAGGYLPEAAQSYVNRAQSLEDGQQIYVPTLAELEKQEIPEHTLSMEQQNTQPSVQAGQGASENISGKVNLNTADETQLTTLGGIGPAKAQAIIAYREENGPFQSIEDIMNVQGIKEGTFAGIKDDIEVG